MMEIGAVIRKYRKEKEMTQEEMAGCLGVTASAVNKWENGNTLPDVALLAPVARLLGITTDTLLSYREKLTEREISATGEELRRCVEKKGLEAAFEFAENKIREYPNCGQLSLICAQILNGCCVIYGLEKSREQEEKLFYLYEKALKDEAEEVREAAAMALMIMCMEKKEYQKAQEYLDKIGERKVNKRQLQGNLYAAEGKTEEAYTVYEGILFSGFHDLNGAFNGILSLALKEKNIEKAEKITEKQKQLASLMEMGKYMEISPELIMAVHDKDSMFIYDPLNTKKTGRPRVMNTGMTKEQFMQKAINSEKFILDFPADIKKLNSVFDIGDTHHLGYGYINRRTVRNR